MSGNLLTLVVFLPAVGALAAGWWALFGAVAKMGMREGREFAHRRAIRAIPFLGWWVVAAFMIYTFAWMGNLLYAVSHIIEPLLGLGPEDISTTAWLLVGIGAFATFYTALGGFKAVIWTDIFQAFALGGGMIIIFWLALGRIEGGWSEMINLGLLYNKFEMFDLTFDMSGVDNVYSSLSIGLFAFFSWYAVTLTAVQRYVSMPTIRDAQRALIVNGIMSAVVCLIFLIIF